MKQINLKVEACDPYEVWTSDNSESLNAANVFLIGDFHDSRGTQEIYNANLINWLLTQKANTTMTLAVEGYPLDYQHLKTEEQMQSHEVEIPITRKTYKGVCYYLASKVKEFERVTGWDIDQDKKDKDAGLISNFIKVVEKQLREFIVKFANKYQQDSNKTFPAHESRIRGAIQEILSDDVYGTYDSDYYEKKYFDIPRECISEICTRSKQYRDYRDKLQIEERNNNIIKLIENWLQINHNNGKCLVILGGAAHFDISSSKAATKLLKTLETKKINFILFIAHQFRKICPLKQQPKFITQPQIAPNSSFYPVTTTQVLESNEKKQGEIAKKDDNFVYYYLALNGQR